MTNNPYNNLINLFYEIGALRFLQRSRDMYTFQTVGSVAEHSHRVTIIAYILALKAGADAHKAMLMAAFHDLPETRTGDSNWHEKEYLIQNDKKAWEAQLTNIGNESKEVKKIIKEYRERKTIESQIAKDADNIEYLLSLKELSLQGNEEAKRRIKEDINPKHLYTKIGKEVLKEIIHSKPNEWYQKDRSITHRKYVV